LQNHQGNHDDEFLKYFVPVAGSVAFYPSMEDRLRILFVGEVFGQAGRRIVSEHLRPIGLLWVSLSSFCRDCVKGGVKVDHLGGAKGSH
jgi:hypothetical protein